LDALLGNEALRSGLRTALESGRLAHSVLLCGEPGTGAGFAARCLAADYLYPQGGAGAQQVLKGESPEVMTLEGEGASGEIKVSAVRAARSDVYHTALSAAGRVVLIRGAHKLNGNSANALLKVLEEPPEGVLFILTAPNAAVLLPTIRSRCCTYTLSPLSVDTCAATLTRQYGTPQQQAVCLAQVFGGKLGSAVRCLQDESWRNALADAQQLAQAAQQKDVYTALVLLAKYEKDRPGALLLLQLYAHVCGAAMRGGAQPVSGERAAVGLPAVDDAVAKLSANVNGKTVLTLLAARLTA
jgi:DNA polymerase-3 subunit delta'